MFGDYNLPHAVWFNNEGQDCFRKPGISCKESGAIDLLLGCSGFCNLTQVNTVFNGSDVMLDLIFVTCPNVTVDRAFDVLIEPDTYHPPLYIIFNGLTSSPDHSGVNLEYRDFNGGTFPVCCNTLTPLIGTD